MQLEITKPSVAYLLRTRGIIWLATWAMAAWAGAASAGPIRSVGIMTFVDENTLVIADWRAGELHALHLQPVPPSAPKPFNLKDVSGPIAHALHTDPENLRFEAMAFRPVTELSYITLSIVQGTTTPTPALVAVDATGKVVVVDLKKVSQTSTEIQDAPASDKTLWRDVPEATYTVTDMVYYDNKLYVAGLSNASFASTLRVYAFPFTGAVTASSIEMYHAVHDQLETRAPIRKMAVLMLNGEPTLLAAYTCTPLVTIPIKDLKDGAHILGKTIAELGWGSMPVDMLTFDIGQGPMVLLINSHRSADLLSVAAIAQASSQPGLMMPIKWPSEPLLGVKSTYIPMPGVAQVGAQDTQYLAALRRNEASGVMELVSIRLGAFLRLSDFVNEFDFADFKYGPNDTWHSVHHLLRTEEGYPDLAARAAP